VAAAVEKIEAALAPADEFHEAAAAGAGPDGSTTPAPAVAAAREVTRFEHAVSGRQTPAKRKYVEDQRLEKWRRGESNPRPKPETRKS
jgi:hypothetical protein